MRTSVQSKSSELKKSFDRPFAAVAIGVSAGGLKALETILRKLPVNYALTVMIVQHRVKNRNDFYYRFLDDLCALKVREAEDKMKPENGAIYIAPPDYHMQVEMDRTISLSADPPVCYSRPSVDVLFETAADAYRHDLVGVVLTGANSDGSRGLSVIRQYGGLAVVQDPKTAIAPEMPASAIKKAGADFVLGLEEIGRFIAELKGF